MRVLFLTKSKTDAATRYRADPVMQRLRALDCVVDQMEEPGFFSQMLLLVTVNRYGCVFIQRKLFNGFFSVLLRSFARKIVYDFDDAVFCRSNGEVSATRSRRFARVTSSADLVLAGNEFLLMEASRFSRNVKLVPSCVDVDRYKPETEKPDQLTLVWIGSSSTSRYLESHRDTLEAIGKQFDRIQLKVISDFEFSLEHMRVINISWSEEAEAMELAKSHIGIAPMTDDQWTRGKCALKIIQYMAAGLPVVSSPVGANKEVVQQGETGFLADDKSAWCQAVRELQSRQLREQMGNAGRHAALDQFSMSKKADEVAGFISALRQPL